MQRWLYSPRVVIERSKRRMLGCNKGHDTLVAQKYTGLYEFLSFFSFFFLSFFRLTNRRSSFFFFYLFHLGRRRQKESRYSTQCLDNDVMCLCICVPFPGNVDVVSPTHLFNHLSIHMLSIRFLLPVPVYQFACSNLIISCFKKEKEKESRRW